VASGNMLGFFQEGVRSNTRLFEMFARTKRFWLPPLSPELRQQVWQARGECCARGDCCADSRAL